MVAGLEDVTQGEIYIGGQFVNDMAPKDRDVAMVFQNYALYPYATVYENMAFALRVRKYPKAEIQRRVEAAADTLGIRELLDRRPRQLSGGQRQRVAIGRAIVRNPQIFLFDEPLSNLDAKLRVQMRTEIKQIHQQVGTTILYVTHDQVEAMTLAQRIVVMNGGRIEQIGTPQEMYEQPQSRFVAGFIGSPSMNFIPCRLIETSGRFGGGHCGGPHARRSAGPDGALSSVSRPGNDPRHPAGALHRIPSSRSELRLGGFPGAGGSRGAPGHGHDGSL